MALTIRTERPKSSRDYNQDPRIRSIDELQRIALDARDDFLGDDWGTKVKNFYALEGLLGKAPSFRPQVKIPQLQVLSITEATDITDSSPKVYIYDKKTGENDQQRSRAFQEQWNECFVNYELLFASLWAQFAGVGFLQIGYDPFRDGGFGSIWVKRRDPTTVGIDPGALCLQRPDCTYLVLEDRLYPDQVAYGWPESGAGMNAEAIMPGGKNSPAVLTGMPHKLTFPEGPMRMQNSSLTADEIQSDGRLRVRYLFIDDRTIEVVKEQAGGDSAAIIEKGTYSKRLRYPGMRLIVGVSGSSGRVVADGDNPTPGGNFPLVPIYGLPPLSGFYPPPPTRYTEDLQLYVERLLTQIFENQVRLNNGVWFVDKGTGITAETFGGLPGELQLIEDGSRMPTCVFPQSAANPQVMGFIQSLLALQKELQGHSSSREGSPGAGNLSPELFEASIYQSQRLTRCRVRLLSRSVHQIATQMYNLMCANYTEPRAFASNEGGFATYTWKPVYGVGARNMHLYIDPDSLQPMSQAALRQLAPMLRQEGALDVQTLLEWLQVPDAAGIAGRQAREAGLAALMKVKRR